MWQCELTHMEEIMTLMNVIHYAHISSFEEKRQTWRERKRENEHFYKKARQMS